jgi:hypothetical protein
VDLNTFIVAVFCLIDDRIEDRALRARGRVHARVCWPGVITRISVAPANAHELSVLPEIAEFSSGLIVGDRNYHSPKRRKELAGMGVELLAPYSSK